MSADRKSREEITSILTEVHLDLVSVAEMLEVLYVAATEGRVTCGQMRLLRNVVQNAVDEIEGITTSEILSRAEAAA